MSNWSCVLTYAKSISTYFNNLEDKKNQVEKQLMSDFVSQELKIHVRSLVASELAVLLKLFQNGCIHLSNLKILFLRSFFREINKFWFLDKKLQKRQKRNMKHYHYNCTIVTQLGQQRK